MDISTIRDIHTVHVGEGSGVIVKTYNIDYLYLLTDYHVVKKTAKEDVICRFSSDSPLKDRIIVILDELRDEENDLAIFKISPEGLDEIEYLPVCGKSTVFPFNHVGFPKQRQKGKAISESLVLPIIHADGIVKGHLMEYGYGQAPKKEEIDGMSGGGIYDGLLRLMGLHKQSSNIDENELLGKAVYIPISAFKKTLEGKAGWCPIQEFDLQTFETFTNEVFAFKNDAFVKQAAGTILIKLEEYEEQIENQLSPVGVINTLKELHYLPADMIIEEQCRDFWISFSEFVIGIMVLMDFTISKENLIEAIYEKFHFVYSNEPFDLFEARQKLDISLLRGMRKDAKLVVGGLIPSASWKGCVLPPSCVIPTITCAEQYNERDIKRSDRRLLDNIRIANNSIFRHAVVKCVDDEKPCIEYFKELLVSKLK